LKIPVKDYSSGKDLHLKRSKAFGEDLCDNNNRHQRI